MENTNFKWGYIVFMIIMAVSIVFNVLQYRQQIQLHLELNSKIDETYEYLDSLTVESFERQVMAGENLFVYIGRTGCGDCNWFAPILRNTLEIYELTDKFKYVDVEKYRESNADRWGEFKKKYGFSQTPALLIFDKDGLISMIEWNTNGLSEERLIDWLKQNQLVKIG